MILHSEDRAARGGNTKAYLDHDQPKDANTWQGVFPVVNSGTDGFVGLAPSGCYALDSAKAPSQHTDQYYYIFGSRAIYKDGWKASLAYPNHFVSGGPDAGKTFDENAWELYNMYPEKVTELRALFEQEAKDHNLYPLITWDDVMNMRIHRSKDTKSLQDEIEKIASHHADKN